MAVVFAISGVFIGGSSAQASEPIATYVSPPCPQEVATWHIAYRLYWVSTLGQTTSEAAEAAFLDQAADLVQRVRTDSDCGVRISLDVFDEGPALWPATPESTVVPNDTAAFLARGPYDWIFYRFPSNQESYCANSTVDGGPSLGQMPSFSRFPVDPDGRLGCEAGKPSDCECEPNSILMEHEWLHGVVAFYNPRLSWPVPDVHGSCAHGYVCSGVNGLYFADLMQGKVQEGGAWKGIQQDEWTRQGTPANPLIRHPQISLENDAQGMVVQFPQDLGAPVHISIADSAGKPVWAQDVFLPGFKFSLPGPGAWTACVDFGGSENYYRSRVCSSLVVTSMSAPPAAAEPFNHRTSKQFRHLHISRKGQLYRIVSRELPPESVVQLVVTHRGRRLVLAPVRRGSDAIFSIRATDRYPWRVRLDVSMAGGQRVKSRLYILHP